MLFFVNLKKIKWESRKKIGQNTLFFLLRTTSNNISAILGKGARGKELAMLSLAIFQFDKILYVQIKQYKNHTVIEIKKHQ